MEVWHIFKEEQLRSGFAENSAKLNNLVKLWDPFPFLLGSFSISQTVFQVWLRNSDSSGSAPSLFPNAFLSSAILRLLSSWIHKDLRTRSPDGFSTGAQMGSGLCCGFVMGFTSQLSIDRIGMDKCCAIESCIVVKIFHRLAPWRVWAERGGKEGGPPYITEGSIHEVCSGVPARIPSPCICMRRFRKSAWNFVEGSFCPEGSVFLCREWICCRFGFDGIMEESSGTQMTKSAEDTASGKAFMRRRSDPSSSRPSATDA